MNWVQFLTKSIDYIEDNLKETLSIADISKVANTSNYHYQRMFHMITGIPVGEYIRNRRLSASAGELISTNKRVLDIALEYGYESSEAFSRAFKKLHGCNPSQVRKGEGSIKAYPRVTIQLVVKGDEAMEYKIERKPKFEFMGLKKRVENAATGENFVTIPKFWKEVMENGSLDRLMGHSSNGKSIGACLPMNSKEDNGFNYIIGVFSKNKDEAYTSYAVPEADWAVFEVKGPVPKALQETWHRIYAEWFPATGFKSAKLPELEVYGHGDVTSEDYVTEIWIPIIKE